MIKRFKLPALIILLSFLATLPLIIPYFHKGYFPSHDGEWAVVRMGDMFRSLRDHQLPVRWSGYLNFQYGYPLFNFAYPMPYYLGTLFHFLGFGFINSVKLVFAFSVFFSGLGMYLCAKLLWKRSDAAIVSALLYLYFPYRIVDLYVRGSIGESVSLALFPFLLYFTLRIREHNDRLAPVFGGVCLALLVSSHNIMTVLFVPILLVCMGILVWKDKKTIPSFLVFLFFGIGLSAFFWFPALLEKHLILLAQTPIADRNLYFVKPLQLLSMPWGYGTPTDSNPFPYTIGMAHIIGFLTVIGMLLFTHKKEKTPLEKMMMVFLSSIFVIMLVFLFSPTAFIWKTLPLLKEINYPWTLLAPIGFVLALLSGSIMLQKKIRLVGWGIAFLAVLLTLPFAHPKKYISTTDSYYLTNQATTTSSHELMPLWVHTIPSASPDQKVQILSGAGTVSDFASSSRQVHFTVQATTPVVVRINSIYYPGWQVRNDGNMISINTENDKGVMDITLPSGEHSVIGTFTETPLRLGADAFSLITLLGMLSYCFMMRKSYAKR